MPISISAGLPNDARPFIRDDSAYPFFDGIVLQAPYKTVPAEFEAAVATEVDALP